MHSSDQCLLRGLAGAVKGGVSAGADPPGGLLPWARPHPPRLGWWPCGRLGAVPTVLCWAGAQVLPGLPWPLPSRGSRLRPSAVRASTGLLVARPWEGRWVLTAPEVRVRHACPLPTGLRPPSGSWEEQGQTGAQNTSCRGQRLQVSALWCGPETKPWRAFGARASRKREVIPGRTPGAPPAPPGPAEPSWPGSPHAREGRARRKCDWAAGAAPEAGSRDPDGRGLREPPAARGPRRRGTRLHCPLAGGTPGPSGEGFWRGPVWTVMGTARGHEEAVSQAWHLSMEPRDGQELAGPPLVSCPWLWPSGCRTPAELLALGFLNGPFPSPEVPD